MRFLSLLNSPLTFSQSRFKTVQNIKKVLSSGISFEMYVSKEDVPIRRMSNQTQYQWFSNVGIVTVNMLPLGSLSSTATDPS